MKRSEIQQCLIEEFGTSEIDLDLVAAKYLAMTPRTANMEAGMNRLPFPTYRLGGQKSPRKVAADQLARVIESRRKEAEREWLASQTPMGASAYGT